MHDQGPCAHTMTHEIFITQHGGCGFPLLIISTSTFPPPTYPTLDHDTHTHTPYPLTHSCTHPPLSPTLTHSHPLSPTLTKRSITTMFPCRGGGRADVCVFECRGHSLGLTCKRCAERCAERWRAMEPLKVKVQKAQH